MGVRASSDPGPHVHTEDDHNSLQQQQKNPQALNNTNENNKPELETTRGEMDKVLKSSKQKQPQHSVVTQEN